MFLLWLTGGLACVLLAGIAWMLAPLTPGVLALQLTFTPRAFGQIVHAWPAAHLALYRAHFPFDFALLACYGAFGALLARRTTLFAGHGAMFRGFARWALPAAAGCDALENVLHLWLTAAPRFGTQWPYAVAGVAASAKIGLLVGFALALVWALASRQE